MVRHLILACLLFLINQSCQAQQHSLQQLIGRWIVQTDQRSFEKNGKVTKIFKEKKVSREEAFVYDFKSDNLVSITNFKREFKWDFKVERKDCILTLYNINGDAEDDELQYSIKNGVLTFVRKIEDADPDDDEQVIVVSDRITLKKL